MVNYISMEAIFPLLPLNRDVINKDEIIELGAQCLQTLRHKTNYTRKVVLVEIENFKGKLPIDLFKIEVVARPITSVSNGCGCLDLTTIDVDVDRETKTTTVTYNTSTYTSDMARPNSAQGANYNRTTSMITQCIESNIEWYIGSGTFNKHFEFMEAINQPFTTGKHCDHAPSLICPGCPQKYSINPLNEILTSFESGYIFISYLAEPVTEENIPLILDDIDMKQAIVSFIMMKHWENRLSNLERNSFELYNKYQDQYEKLALKLKGKLNLENINSEKVIQMTSDRYKHILGNPYVWNMSEPSKFTNYKLKN